MSGVRGVVLGGALALALTAGLLVAWTPRYWPNTVVTAGVALVAVLWAVLSDRISLPVQTVLVVPITCWGLIQSALGIPVVSSVTGRQSVMWLMCLVAFVLGSQLLRRSGTRAAFLDVMLWVCTALAVEAIIQTILSPGRVFGFIPAELWVVGTLYYKNHFAAMMELAAPIALWRLMNGKVFAGSACFSLILAATVASASRAGAIVVVGELVLFVLVAVLGKRLQLQSGLTVVAVVVVVSAAAVAVVGPEILWERMKEENPYHLRAQFTDSTLKMIPERPLTGFGMGTWKAVYPRFATLDMAVIANEAHNDWVQWGAEGGLVFLALMAALVL